MKVTVIGNGHVGKAVFRELQAFREINELVLVGRNAAACRAEAEDYMDAIPLRMDNPSVIWGGGYELAEGSDILIYCAGPSISKAEDRLSIVNENMEVLKSVFDEVDKYAPNAMVIVVSNPLDVVTTAITKYTGRPSNRVIGTGTLLDTARLIKYVSWEFDVSHKNVSGFVIGEHGGSSVVLMSQLRIMNMHYADYLARQCNGIVPLSKDGLNEDVRDAGFRVFRGKGYTSSGVAAATARIVFDIINNTREIIPVSTLLSGEYGYSGFAMSVPCQIGKDGIENIKTISINDEERELLDKSAKIISDTCKSVGY